MHTVGAVLSDEPSNHYLRRPAGVADSGVRPGSVACELAPPRPHVGGRGAGAAAAYRACPSPPARACLRPASSAARLSRLIALTKASSNSCSSSIRRDLPRPILSRLISERCVLPLTAMTGHSMRDSFAV